MMEANQAQLIKWSPDNILGRTKKKMFSCIGIGLKKIESPVSKGGKATKVPIPLINLYHKNIKNDNITIRTKNRKPAKCFNHKKTTNMRVYSHNGTRHGH